MDYLQSNLIELTAQSPAASQPNNIDITLRPHQLTLLQKCKQLEEGDLEISTQYIPSSIHMPPSTVATRTRLRTRIGVIADKVGSGKSNVILSLIAMDDESPDMMSTMTTTYSYGLNHINMIIEQEKRMCNVNILVIPHNLVSQWTRYIETFFKNPIKTAIIAKTKSFETLSIDNIKDHRLIVVTCTFYPRLVSLLKRSQIQVRRAIYDEVDCMNISSSDIIDSSFYWFVTASYMNLIHPRGHGRYDRNTSRYIVVAEGMRTGGYIKTLFMALHTSNGAMLRNVSNLIIAKNNDNFVDQSVSLPPINFQYIKCKTPRTIRILNGIVDREIITALNSGDIEAAISHINPSHRNNEDNIISILLEKYTKSLHNCNTMLEYVTNIMQYDTPLQREHEIDRLQKKRDEFQKKINDITARIKETDACCICYDNFNVKTIVNCCMSAYCFKCINTWLSQRTSCPTCRAPLDVEKLFVVRSEDTKECPSTASAPTNAIDLMRPHESFDKMKNLENVIRLINDSYANNKVLIFSMNENSFDQIQDLLNGMNRRFKMLKGRCVAIANTVEQFKTGDLNTLLVNPENYGSGLNLENTTDLIMLHKFDSEIEKQVIGRAQRYGRMQSLRVWYLLYENEQSNA